MPAYYNEFDPYAAQWLRNLIAAGHIAPGDVDERSIADVQPDDLRGYTQCHFFAGLGGWSLALRLAGWDDGRPVWTGSCPCQPFSAAGRQAGAADERDLWPVWAALIRDCRPLRVFGEQVEGAVRHGWLDRVRADLEAEGYALGAVVLGAHSVGAPHIRQRLWWVADTGSERRQQVAGSASGDESAHGRTERDHVVAGDGESSRGRLADAPRERECADQIGRDCGERIVVAGARSRRDSGDDRAIGGMADGTSIGRRERGADAGRDSGRDREEGRPAGSLHSGTGGRLGDADGLQSEQSARQRSGSGEAPGGRSCGESAGPGSTCRMGDADGTRLPTRERDKLSGTDWLDERRAARQSSRTPWSGAIWIPCADGKARRIEPGIFPLSDGLSTCLERVRAVEGAALTEIVAYGTASKTDPREVLRELRDFVRARASREGSAVGVREQLPAPALLLDFLLCLDAAQDGAANRSGFEKAGAEVRDRIVRRVRLARRSGGSSRQWRPDEQFTGEPPNPLHGLSLVLARHAETHGAHAAAAYAADGRVGKLRAAGNAIVPQVAAAFIAAAEECIG